MGRTRSWTLLVTALIVGILVATGLGSWQMSIKGRPAPAPVADDDHARERVTELVATNVVKVLSFTPTTSRGDIEVVTKLLTGSAVDEYRKAMRAKADGVTQTARVRTGVESLSADEAQVVAFVDQTSETAGGGPSTKDALAYRVSLSRVDGEWLISELEPL
jgi:Mce-associated membrane protein